MTQLCSLFSEHRFSGVRNRTLTTLTRFPLARWCLTSDVCALPSRLLRIGGAPMNTHAVCVQEASLTIAQQQVLTTLSGLGVPSLLMPARVCV